MTSPEIRFFQVFSDSSKLIDKIFLFYSKFERIRWHIVQVSDEISRFMFSRAQKMPQNPLPISEIKMNKS